MMNQVDLKPVSARAAGAALLSIAAGLLFALLLGSLHVLEPEFDPTWRFISEYALGNVGWMMHLAFLALALSLASAGVAIFAQVRTIVGYLGLAGLGLAAIGILIAAIFKTDPMTAGRAAATFSGTMHVFGASLDYTPVAALLLSFTLARNPAWRPIRTRLFVAAGVTLVALAAFMVVLPYDGHVGPGVLAGLFGRFLLLSYLAWLLPVNVQVIRLRGAPSLERQLTEARGSVSAAQGVR
jgi:hypothetical protein